MGGYSFVGKEYVYQSLKLLKLGCELKFIPFRHKIYCRYFRYFHYGNENEKFFHFT